jgi:hypothetical protein
MSFSMLSSQAQSCRISLRWRIARMTVVARDAM